MSRCFLQYNYNRFLFDKFFSGYVCVCVCSLVFGGLIVLSVCLSLLYSESCIDFLMGSVVVWLTLANMIKHQVANVELRIRFIQMHSVWLVS